MPYVVDYTAAVSQLFFEYHQQLIIEWVCCTAARVGNKDIYMIYPVLIPAACSQGSGIGIRDIIYLTGSFYDPMPNFLTGTLMDRVAEYPAHGRYRYSCHFCYFFQRHIFAPFCEIYVFLSDIYDYNTLFPTCQLGICEFFVIPLISKRHLRILRRCPDIRIITAVLPP